MRCKRPNGPPASQRPRQTRDWSEHRTNSIGRAGNMSRPWGEVLVRKVRLWLRASQNGEALRSLLNLGFGVQQDAFLEESANGLSGLNLGVGRFLTEDLALMFRFSGTNVSYDFGFLGDYNQVSGVAGPTLQYWVSDRFNLEGGLGVGFWNSEGPDERGVGLILGAGVTLFNRGKHNLQLGFEYAPAFTEGTVHNVGFAFGYQFL